ncbi:MAG: flagellar protein FliT [Candidatus Thiodiazotropha sp. (ex Codakia rugifera)]|nr:flagellar protein FliT [Candidatus Thiodiazotropha sp. (ex Codakia rugifera)]
MLQHKENLELALELSQEIVRLAQEKAWPEMEQLDQQRLQLLKAFFSAGDFNSHDRMVEESIQSILDLNDRALAICAEARDFVMEDGRKVRLGREAIAAYQKQSFD